MKRNSNCQCSIAGEDGSMVLYMFVFMTIMMTLTVMIVDVGQMVFDRIRLQTTVDACALAAATVQSVGLNEIADLNYEAKLEYRKVRKILSKGTWYNEKEAEEVNDFYDKVFNALTRYRHQANFDYARKAVEYAEETFYGNPIPNAFLFWAGANSGKMMEMDHDDLDVSYRYYDKSCDDCSKKKTVKWHDPDDPNYWGEHDGSYKKKKRRKKKKRNSHTFDEVLWSKREFPQAYAAFGIYQHPKDFILGSKLFETRMPAMSAYAAAKPTGGHIALCRPEYEAILVLMKKLNPPPQVPNLYSMEH